MAAGEKDSIFLVCSVNYLAHSSGRLPLVDCLFFFCL